MSAQSDLAKREAGPDVVVLSVKLESGQFEASIRVPLTPDTTKNFDKHVADWLMLTHTALQRGVLAMDATLAEATP